MSLRDGRSHTTATPLVLISAALEVFLLENEHQSKQIRRCGVGRNPASLA